MPTSFKWKRHVTVSVPWEVGDKVKVDPSWGSKMPLGEQAILEIKLTPGSESSVSVLLSGYASFLDSGWIL